MSRKMKIIVSVYALAAITALGVYARASRNSLVDYRLAAKYSADRAFEETVGAVSTLSSALEKSVYATDGGMCSRICSEAFASAQAAETAMSTLPFSTQELEHISAFLNVAGDYTYTLSAQAAEEGFSEEQLKALTGMAAQAAELTEALRRLQGGVDGGEVIMDSREVRLRNVEPENGPEKLSARLLQYESSFRPQAELEYDGKYGGKAEKNTDLRLTEEEMLSLAAEFAGVDKSELKKEYDYEGESGRRCYSAGELLICVSPAGVESMSQSRLVSESGISLQEAEEKAKKFLSANGFVNMELTESGENGAIAFFKFARTENGALCMDNTVSVSIAVDDGSVYSFNASSFSAEKTGVMWKIDEDTAAEKLPESLRLEESRKVIMKSPGGKNRACYEFTCYDRERQVKIYVDAETGKQCRIVMGNSSGAAV